MSRVVKMCMLGCLKKNTCSLTYSLAAQIESAPHLILIKLLSRVFCSHTTNSVSVLYRTWRVKVPHKLYCRLSANANYLLIFSLKHKPKTNHLIEWLKANIWIFIRIRELSLTKISKFTDFSTERDVGSLKGGISPFCTAIMVPCWKMTGVRMRTSLFLSTANCGHSLCFVFSIIDPFTKRRQNECGTNAAVTEPTNFCSFSLNY